MLSPQPGDDVIRHHRQAPLIATVGHVRAAMGS